ncbi:MAG: hypothetical protein IMY71_02085 [Bacteroidetes bacterium]|nr:hypothetical protein [Bacteroidota bacterium]
MKQILPVLLVLLISLGGCSTKRFVRQAEHLIDDGKLEDAREMIQLATDSAVNNQWAKTYLVYGKLAQTAATSKKKKDQNLFKNPLQLAYKNYMKALDMDEKGKLDNSVSLLLPKLSNDFVDKGVKAFKARKYSEAMISFEYVSKIAEYDIFKGSVDTGIIYNAGLAAYNAEIYEKAVKYFTTCKEMDYGGVNLYLLLKNTYASMNDSANVLQVLIEAFEKFPEEKEVLVQLVNYYISAGMNNETLNFLKIAKEKDPDNATYFFAEGVIYDRIGKVKNAKNAYQRSIDLDPEFFTSQYNLGALIYNQGVIMVEEANKILDNEKYTEAREATDLQFAEALPYLEKAHELNKGDIETMETLKLIYYILKMMDKHSRIDRELQNLKQKI